jgi:hypothetical protein
MLGEGSGGKEKHGIIALQACLEYSRTDVRMINKLFHRNIANGLNWLKIGFNARLS